MIDAFVYIQIRNMTEKVPSFKTGGTFWFTDLTTADTTYILPLLTAITFIITVESNMQEGMEGNPVEGNPVAGTMKKFSRIIVFLSIPILMGIEKEEVDSVISDIPRDGPRRPTKNASVGSDFPERHQQVALTCLIRATLPERCGEVARHFILWEPKTDPERPIRATTPGRSRSPERLGQSDTPRSLAFLSRDDNTMETKRPLRATH
ncbi:hypothetical protein YC2023_083081 [Brassica napus]